MLYLGFDCSTQSLTAVVVEISDHHRKIVFEYSLNFDRDLPEYGTTAGVPRLESGEVVAPPEMWADALDRAMAAVATTDLEIEKIRAISGSAQQHGSVYLTRDAAALWHDVDPSHGIAGQLPPAFSRAHSPVWMDETTTVECREIEERLGGPEDTAALTGSRAFERFTGPQIRKFSKTQPGAYAATARIHLVSSFLASLLIGHDAAIDFSDGSGMNLMDIRRGQWSRAAVDATAPELAERLPPLVPSRDFIGRLSPYWQKRYSFRAIPVVAWTGDNPSSLIGTGVIRGGLLGVSLGTSDTVFACTPEPVAGSSHVFRSPTGDYMSLVCFRNGSLTREWVRYEQSLDWDGFTDALERTPAGNANCIMLPWLEPEITPQVRHAGLRRFGFDQHAEAANVRGVVEGQMMAIANHAAAMMPRRIDRVIATGGGSNNKAILQVMADVFGTEVCRLDLPNSAALGAALRAFQADSLVRGEPVTWKTAVSIFTEPRSEETVTPIAEHVAVYEELRRRYAMLESVHKDRPPLC